MKVKLIADGFDELEFEHIYGVTVDDCRDTVSVLMHKYTRDPWKALFDSLDDGTYKDKYKIGDEFPLDLGEEGYIHMQIAGFDKEAKVTLIAKEILATRTRMNPTFEIGHLGTGTCGGYPATDMRVYLNNNVYYLIPEYIRNRIIRVAKRSCGYISQFDDPEIYNIKEAVWIPSYHEVFGEEYANCLGNPSYKEFFDFTHSRIKHRVNQKDPDSWWLRSAVRPDCFLQVNAFGMVSTHNASHPGGVVFGFCVN